MDLTTILAQSRALDEANAAVKQAEKDLKSAQNRLAKKKTEAATAATAFEAMKGEAESAMASLKPGAAKTK